MDFAKRYYEFLEQTLRNVYQSNKEHIQEAADLLYQTQCNNHTIYTFGTGHSHMIGQDLYARAGGYAKIYPIDEIELSLATHPTKSTQIERMAEYANVLEHLYDVRYGDVVIVTSNSGRNALVIEYVLRLRKKGVKIIAITSLKHSQNTESRHKSKKRLFELADIVLDNQAPLGDAGVAIDENITMGPVSTITGCFLSQCMIGSMVEKLKENGMAAPVFRSSNTDGADAYNQALFDTYILKKGNEYESLNESQF